MRPSDVGSGHRARSASADRVTPARPLPISTHQVVKIMYAQKVSRQETASQIHRCREHPGLKPSLKRSHSSLTVSGAPCLDSRCVLYLEGALRAPLDGELRRNVRRLLRRRERNIVVDLARVSRIDAEGVSELVRAYKMASAAQSVLQIVNATSWVRQTLERVGLFGILSRTY